MQPIVALTENAVAPFRFVSSKKLPSPLITIDKGVVGYDGSAVLRNMNLRLDQEDRIALLGANGEGKSTLSKLIAGRLELMNGELDRTNKLKVGFFST